MSDGSKIRSQVITYLNELGMFAKLGLVQFTFATIESTLRILLRACLKSLRQFGRVRFVTKRIYPSDLSDGEWQYLKKCLPTQKHFGRPLKHQRREILNAIFYLVRTGCAWRYLPRDYPPWKTVYHYFREFRQRGMWRKLNQGLRRMVRKRAGRAAQSSVGVLDSQSVKTVDTASAANGFDSGKRVKGRKRHILCDSLGLVIAVVVHAANISETAGARLVLAELSERWWRLRLIWLDGGYKTSLIDWLALSQALAQGEARMDQTA